MLLPLSEKAANYTAGCALVVPIHFHWESKRLYGDDDVANQRRSVVPGGAGQPWRPQILADQLTLSQRVWTDYAHLITTGTPKFSDLPTALQRDMYYVLQAQRKHDLR